MKIIKLFMSFLTVVIILVASLIITAAFYISTKFSNQSLNEMLFYLNNGVEGTSNEVFVSGIKESIVPLLITFGLCLIPIIKVNKNINIIEINAKRKRFKFTLFPSQLLYRFRFLYASLLLLLSLTASFYLVGVDQYIKQKNSFSTIFEEHYVNPKDVAITFPEKKRNFIVLYLESAENSLLSAENGGGWEYTVVPELEGLAMDNINFSNSDKIGGALPVEGTGWTVAGLVGTSAGIPLKIPIDGNEYTTSDNFLSGAYALGDVLKNEGYNLEFMVGSYATFGGRSNYYNNHGGYEIFDLYTAISEGKMLESDIVWWGFDDSNLFKWAKEEITELANKEGPFSFSFLTVNTHFPDGYLEDGVENTFNTQYENVFAHSSKQVNDFVNWLKTQDFYENTTLVILGDHLSMQDPEFFKTHMDSEYTRTIYNAFINSPAEPNNSKNRQFTPLDMYPTILASIGVDIESNRLGLGTNLFSNRETLVEELGYEHVNEELIKNSNYYNNNILQDDYLELLDKAESEKEQE